METTQHSVNATRVWYEFKQKYTDIKYLDVEPLLIQKILILKPIYSM